MFTFVIGISCGNTPFVQKHESTTHVNGFVFDSIFSVGKYFVRMFHAHRVCKPKPVFIRKKEKFPLKLRCSLNNNKVLCKLCLRIKPLSCTPFRYFLTKILHSRVSHVHLSLVHRLSFSAFFESTSTGV